MFRRVIIFSCVLWGLAEAGAHCGFQMECVPQGLCKSPENVQGFQSPCQRHESCCHSSQILTVGAPLNCGMSNPNGLGNGPLVDVNQAMPHEFPWVVALMQPDTSFFGAGTLVTENVVITAGHLMQDKKVTDFLIVAGAWDLNQLYQSTVATRSPARIISHPGFDNQTGANNIALIILDLSFNLKPTIGTICWPTPGVSFDRERCVVAGWGRQNTLVQQYSSRQKKIELPIVNSAWCEDQLRRTLDMSYKLDSTLLCAGGERSRDACDGDGGSPLMCPILGHPGIYQFVGIVSSGVSCGMENVPGVYTDIAKMKSWIDDHLSDELNKPYKSFPVYNIDFD
ncbi:phenoloxidase-activating factor 2 [Drosophila eugracilis]|uniref:phenoloxidase-activating factor 2 n=1 Tax=Drosophila eugracilis TaxID=29029 RepID=UPI001BD951C6|nr:phenoloxidase-activating factor 2 [Drosophila eugracilis]